MAQKRILSRKKNIWKHVIQFVKVEKNEENFFPIVYEGESSRSARLRGIEHLQSMSNEPKDSIIYKHKFLEHENVEVDFDMENASVFKCALTSQADEAVRIHSRGNEELLNSKSEFNQPPTARLKNMIINELGLGCDNSSVTTMYLYIIHITAYSAIQSGKSD